VTSIGHNAFSGCTSLTSVVIPASTSMAFTAFFECARIVISRRS
jgi:hypothetical protein